MNCVTLSLLKIFYQNGFIPEEEEGFERYRYQRNTEADEVFTIEEMIKRINSFTQNEFKILRRHFNRDKYLKKFNISNKDDLIRILKQSNNPQIIKTLTDVINSVVKTTRGQMMSLYLFNLTRIDNNSDAKQRLREIVGSSMNVNAQESFLFNYPITDLNKKPLFEPSWQKSKDELAELIRNKHPKYDEKNYKGYKQYVDDLNKPQSNKPSQSMIFVKNYQLPSIKFQKKT